MSDRPTNDIVRAVLDGDTEAFGDLAMRTQAGIRAFLAVRIGDVHEAEDIAQEVFVIAFQRLADFDTSRSMNAWLGGIAANLLRNYVRKRRERLSPDEAGITDLVEREVTRIEEEHTGERLLEALRACMASLAGQARTLVEYKYKLQLGIAEICARVGRKHSAITMALHRIRAQLRDCIQRRVAGSEGDAS